MFSLFYTLHTGIASPGYCRREYLVTVQTYARATEHMETPKPRTSESVSRLEVSMCDSGWQRVNSNNTCAAQMDKRIIVLFIRRDL